MVSLCRSHQTLVRKTGVEPPRDFTPLHSECSMVAISSFPHILGWIDFHFCPLNRDCFMLNYPRWTKMDLNHQTCRVSDGCATRLRHWSIKGELPPFFYFIFLLQQSFFLFPYLRLRMFLSTYGNYNIRLRDCQESDLKDFHRYG